MAFRWTPATPLPEHDILHNLRSQMEASHRTIVYRRSADMRWIYQPNITDLDSLTADMTLEEADDCCNKAVPIYIFSAKHTIFMRFFLHVIHKYIFQRWHRPYRNEIEYVQFMAKTFLPWLLTSDLQPGPLVDLAASVHAAICNRVETARDAVKDLDPNNLQEPLGPNMPKKWDWCPDMDTPEIIRSQKYFILRPLFQAIIISIRVETYLNVDTDVSQFPVLLIRTGVEDGLSVPVSFEPIASKIHGYVLGSNGQIAAQMTLETAVDFVISLENREIAAFGHQPDPALCTKDLEDGGLFGPEILTEARKLGWGDEPLVGPSSRWVEDPEIALRSLDGAKVLTALSTSGKG